MKKMVISQNGKVLEGTLYKIHQQMCSMLSVSGPRALRAVEVPYKEHAQWWPFTWGVLRPRSAMVYVSLYDGQDRIEDRRGRDISSKIFTANR